MGPFRGLSAETRRAQFLAQAEQFRARREHEAEVAALLDAEAATRRNDKDASDASHWDAAEFAAATERIKRTLFG